IGKRGSNAKLTSRLLGWRLDINKEAAVPEGFNDKINAAAALISQILPNITENQAMVLAYQGVNSLEALQEMEASDLAELGFSPAEAEEIVERVKVYGK
ncbi:MAG: transcription termination/antitermination protein NusA, partial [Opitutales bacterium]|nr:transcription termination/antitermination protein NusA [Opitutales bacterium]